MCEWGHKTYHSDCDACCGESNDADTGWGGFTDHILGRHFNSEEDREEFIRSLKTEIED